MTVSFTKRWGWLPVAALLLAAAAPTHAQNVGIGTTTPTQALDVNGSLRVRGTSGPGTRLLQADATGTLSPAATTYPAGAAIAPALASTTTGLNNPLVAVSGSLAVVLNRGAGTLSVYDVSSPAAPVLRGTATGLSPNTNANAGIGLAVSGTTAAVLNNTGSYPISVFTLGAGAPVLAATITMPAATSGFYAGLAMVGTTLYATADHSGGGQGYFYVYDLSTPGSPVLRNAAANSTTGFFTPTYIAAAGTLACVSAPYGSTAAADHFNVLDVSNPALPVVVATNGGNSAANYTGKARPLAMAPGVLCTLQPENNLLSTYDLSTPASPVLRHTFGTGATPVGVALNGGLAYVACQGSSTLQVIDISGSSAVLRGAVALDASASSVAVSSALVVAANGSAANDLQVFNQPTRSVVVYPDGTASSAPAASLDPTTASNGLTKTGSTFALGGALTQATTVALGANNLSFGTTTGNLGIGIAVPTSPLQVGGAVSVPFTTTGTLASLALGSAHYTVRCTAATTALTLPQPGTCVGRIYVLLNPASASASVALSVATSGSVYDDTTGGAVSALPAGSRYTVQSDGSNWAVIGR